MTIIDWILAAAGTWALAIIAILVLLAARPGWEPGDPLDTVDVDWDAELARLDENGRIRA